MNDQDTVFARATIREVFGYARITAPLEDRENLRCPIPGHDDSTPSFKIVDGTGFKCFGCQAKGGVADLIIALGFASTPAEAALWLQEKRGTTRWQEKAVYPYRDARGAIAYEAVRQERLFEGRPEKKFVMRVPRSGGYEYKLAGITRVLYRLPELFEEKAANRTIVVVEGEKDAERLAALGFAATTNAGGTGWTWTSTFAEPLRGAKRIVVITDCDKVGREAAAHRTGLLTGICGDVRLLDLAPDRTDGFDISDWLDAGNSKSDLERIITATPKFERAAGISATEIAAAAHKVASVLSFDDLQSRSNERVDWFIEGLLRRSGILLIASRPKVGKSDTTRNLAKAVATGSEFLGRRCQRGKVLWIGLEEPIQHLTDRIEIMGMRELDIAYVIEQPEGDESAWLRTVVEEHKPDVVVIDTIGRFARIENINDYSQVTRATQPMLDLRGRFGTTFVLLHHNNAANTTLGSTAWEGVADSIMSLTRGPDGTRFAQTKQRSGTEMEPTVLMMDFDSGAIACKESAFIANQRAAEKRILAYLATVQGATREELANHSGQKTYIGRSAVDSLLAVGFIATNGSGKRGESRTFSIASSRENSLAVSPGKKIGIYIAEDPGDPEETSRGNPGEIPNYPGPSRTIPKHPEASEAPGETSRACEFHRGAPGAACERCGSTFAAHYSASRAS